MSGAGRFSWQLKFALIVSVVVFLGSVLLFAGAVYLPPAVWFLASVLALIAAPIAVIRLFRHASLRSSGNVLLTTVSTTVALPALAVVFYFASLLLPLTPWERDAIASAEAFVLRNGYTAAGHPIDLPVLANDIEDYAKTPEDIANSRRGLLRTRAVGVVGSKGFGYSVLFEYAQPSPPEQSEPRNFFVVLIEANGDILTSRTMPTYPGWYIKRNAR